MLSTRPHSTCGWCAETNRRVQLVGLTRKPLPCGPRRNFAVCGLSCQGSGSLPLVESRNLLNKDDAREQVKPFFRSRMIQYLPFGSCSLPMWSSCRTLKVPGQKRPFFGWRPPPPAAHRRRFASRRSRHRGSGRRRASRADPVPVRELAVEVLRKRVKSFEAAAQLGVPLAGW